MTGNPSDLFRSPLQGLIRIADKCGEFVHCGNERAIHNAETQLCHILCEADSKKVPQAAMKSYI
jgi:hypothetical protein